MRADLAGFFSRLKRRGSGPRLGRAKQNRTKKSPSCSRYLIQNLPTALLLSNRTNQQQTQSHMQVQFVVGSLPRSERFFPGYSGFPSPQKQTLQNFNGPFPSSKNSHFQNEAKCKNLSCENDFHLHENKKIIFTLKGLCHGSPVHFV